MAYLGYFNKIIWDIFYQRACNFETERTRLPVHQDTKSLKDKTRRLFTKIEIQNGKLLYLFQKHIEITYAYSKNLILEETNKIVPHTLTLTTLIILIQSEKHNFEIKMQ